ncbi:MAG: hypothetical protein ACQEXQ_28090 [Bacillota bacterium]
MKIKKRYLLLVVFFLLITIIAFIWMRNITDRFGSFSITISNKSDYDIVSVETGIIKGTSKDIYTEVIKSGEKIKIKPRLSLTGEGAIYINYTNSNGDTKEKTVCGYTESLSGYSKVTINDDKVTVEENCM